MTREELQTEANTLLKQGFQAAEGDWRSGVSVKYIDRILPPMECHGRMYVFSKADIESESYRATLRDAGRTAAEHFVRRVVGQALPLIVTLPQGRDYPVAEAFEDDSGDLGVRCYHDFGIEEGFIYTADPSMAALGGMMTLADVVAKVEN